MKPLRKKRKAEDVTEMWNKLPWKQISLEETNFDDFDESVLFGLEEIDGNAYKLMKTGSGYTVTVDDQNDNTTNTEKKSKQKSKSPSMKEDIKSETTATRLVDITTDTKLWGDIHLNSLLYKALETLGFTSPTPIQQNALPISINGMVDVIGAAETGSGKTLAFILPVLNYLLMNASSLYHHTTNRRHALALIIAPTRELALQITKVLKDIIEQFKTLLQISVVPIVGGMSEQKQRRLLGPKSRPPDIIVGTPGRLCEMIQDPDIETFRDMSRLKYLIVDEADRIVEEGHFPELHRLFSRIRDHEKLVEQGLNPIEVEKSKRIGTYEEDYEYVGNTATTKNINDNHVHVVNGNDDDNDFDRYNNDEELDMDEGDDDLVVVDEEEDVVYDDFEPMPSIEEIEEAKRQQTNEDYDAYYQEEEEAEDQEDDDENDTTVAADEDNDEDNGEGNNHDDEEENDDDDNVENEIDDDAYNSNEHNSNTIDHTEDAQYNTYEMENDNNTNLDTTNTTTTASSSLSYTRQTFLYSATAIQTLSTLNMKDKNIRKKMKQFKHLPEHIKQLPLHLQELLSMIAITGDIRVIDVTGTALSHKKSNSISVTNTESNSSVDDNLMNSNENAITQLKSNNKKNTNININTNSKNDIKENQHSTTSSSSSAVVVDSSTSIGGPIVLPKGLIQYEIRVPSDEKDTMTYLFLLQHPGRTIVFVNSIKTARRLDGLLRALELNSRTIHAQLQQRQRLRALESYQSSMNSILVATDVAARGLDMNKIKYVVHYDVARSPQVYIHRSGRTARAGESGTVMSIVSPQDTLHHMSICQTLGSKSLPLYKGDLHLLPILNERVTLAKKIFTQSFVQSQQHKSKSWLESTALEADLELDDELLDELQDEEDSRRGHGRNNKNDSQPKQMSKNALEKARKELKQMLKQPLHNYQSSSTTSNFSSFTSNNTNTSIGYKSSKSKYSMNIPPSYKRRGLVVVAK